MAWTCGTTYTYQVYLNAQAIKVTPCPIQLEWPGTEDWTSQRPRVAQSKSINELIPNVLLDMPCPVVTTKSLPSSKWDPGQKLTDRHYA